MFGYVMVNLSALGEEERARFRACYCGLCRTLGERWGLSGRALLSYDMVFLAMLLGSLYEPEEETGRQRCPVRPWRTRGFARSGPFAYAADMNVAYAYFKAADDARDEGGPLAAARLRLLAGRYARVESLYPETCARVREAVAGLSRLEEGEAAAGPGRSPRGGVAAGLSRPEAGGAGEIDAAANRMGELFGAVYAWRDDFWREPLFALGAALGRFVYLCDAWEDREADEKKGRYNPLSACASRPDYDEFVRRALTMVIGEGAQAFELLPLQRDAAILRNILYSGVWSRWTRAHERRARGGRRAPTARKDADSRPPVDKRRTTK